MSGTSSNVCKALMYRELGGRRPGTATGNSRRFFQSLCPNIKVQQLDVPEVHICRFSPCGQYLVCMAGGFTQLVVYRFTGPRVSWQGELDEQDIAGKLASFSSFFSVLYRVPLAPAGEVLAKDVVLFMGGGGLLLLASHSPITSPAGPPPPDADPLMSLPYAESINLHLVRLSDGVRLGGSRFESELVDLSGRPGSLGVCAHEDLIAVLALRRQEVHLLQVLRGGEEVVLVRSLGPQVQEDDPLVLRCAEEAEERWAAARRAEREAAGTRAGPAGPSLPLLHAASGDPQPPALPLMRRSITGDLVRSDLPQVPLHPAAAAAAFPGGAAAAAADEGPGAEDAATGAGGSGAGAALAAPGPSPSGVRGAPGGRLRGASPPTAPHGALASLRGSRSPPPAVAADSRRPGAGGAQAAAAAAAAPDVLGSGDSPSTGGPGGSSGLVRLHPDRSGANHNHLVVASHPEAAVAAALPPPVAVLYPPPAYGRQRAAGADLAAEPQAPGSGGTAAATAADLAAAAVRQAAVRQQLRQQQYDQFEAQGGPVQPPPRRRAGVAAARTGVAAVPFGPEQPQYGPSYHHQQQQQPQRQHQPEWMPAPQVPRSIPIPHHHAHQPPHHHSGHPQGHRTPIPPHQQQQPLLPHTAAGGGAQQPAAGHPHNHQHIRLQNRNQPNNLPYPYHQPQGYAGAAPVRMDTGPPPGGGGAGLGAGGGGGAAASPFDSGLKQRLLAHLYGNCLRLHGQNPRRLQREAMALFRQLDTFRSLLMRKVFLLDRTRLLIDLRTPVGADLGASAFGQGGGPPPVGAPGLPPTQYFMLFDLQTARVVSFRASPGDKVVDKYLREALTATPEPWAEALPLWDRYNFKNVLEGTRQKLQRRAAGPPGPPATGAAGVATGGVPDQPPGTGGAAPASSASASERASTACKMMQLLPPLSASFGLCSSPYLDASLYAYDDRVISPYIRTRPCLEQPISFRPRNRPDRAGGFRWEPGPFEAVVVRERRLARHVAHLFHPEAPFLLAVFSVFHQSSISISFRA